MLMIKYIQEYGAVSNFPLSVVINHAKAFEMNHGRNAQAVDSWSNEQIIDHAKSKMTRNDVIPLDFRNGFVKDHTFPVDVRNCIYTSIDQAWKESPFVIYDNPSYR